MPNDFEAVCDDFYVNLRIGTQMNLPHQRETLLHFFEQIQKSFPDMTRFRRSEQNEYTIEESRERESYRWLSVESQRLSSGHVNPSSIEESMRLHRAVLEHAPYALGLSPVEIDYIDMLYGFDLDFAGNHDEVVAESLFADSPLASLLEEPGARPMDFQPTITVALSDDYRTQARVDVVTRTSNYQVRTGDYSGESISVYLILRKFWGDRARMTMEETVQALSDRAQSLAENYVVPRIVQPIRAAIVSRS